MSSRGSARDTTDAYGRIQRKWATLMRRVDAREAALRNALVHARAKEVELRLQLEREQHRHTIETGILSKRLKRLEESFLDYIAAGRRALRAPGTVVGARGLAEALGTGASLPALGVSNAGSGADAKARAREAQAPAPFDPVATVASMLPLIEPHAGAPDADVAGALGRLQTVVESTGGHIADADAGQAASAAEPLAMTSATPAQDGQREQPPAEDRAVALETSPVGSDTPWFPRAFRRLADEDPEAAGRLFLQLLPAQGLVWPEDVAYNIEVAETGSLTVAARAGRCSVQPSLGSDPGEPTLRTDLAGLARTVAGRRGWSRVGARIASSRNRQMRPLRALAAAPLQLSDLKRAGVKADPLLLLRLLALAIDPGWTAEQTFTVACRWRGRVESGCYLHVFERAPVAITSAPPLGRVAATLSCEPNDMLDILLGHIPLGDSLAQISGDRAPLASLLEWFQRVDATATKIPAEPAVVTAAGVAA
jgi:hypothetical protein